MASEIIASIREAENKCDERIAAAKAEAAKTVEKAGLCAVEYRQKKTDEAKAKAAELIAAARDEAAQTVRKAEEENKSLIEEMRKKAQGNSARAITAVAKKLAELS